MIELFTLSISGALESEPCISVEIKVLLTSIVFFLGVGGIDWFSSAA